MLIEKDVIGPGTIWYNDLKTGEPRKSVVTDAHIQHWCDQGNKMLSQGLTVPVPCEHDFQAHPMTPAEKLVNNAGWVKEYKLSNGRLLSVIDVQDEALAKKLPTTVKWTSPWFSSFTDGKGVKWDNVIAHLALTTRPRIANQQPFPSIAAAMEFAKATPEVPLDSGDGYVLSQFGALKATGDGFVPENRIAFSLYSGVALSEDDVEEPKKDEPKKDGENKNKLLASDDDMKLDKVLCDLLCLIGIPMPEDVDPAQFKKTLYMAATAKIKELSAPKPAPAAPAPGAPPSKKPANPIVQEQQPMYMTLEDINKIPDETMKNMALSMYNETVKMQAALDANNKTTTSLVASKLAEETAKRKMRADRLGRISPRLKTDLEAMLALPAMSLSMGENGAVVDPMASNLTLLEKGLADVPQLLQIEQSALTVQQQPTDAALSQEETDKMADDMARMMGCPPEKKAG